MRALVRDKVQITDAAVEQMFDTAYGARRQARLLTTPDLAKAQYVIERARAGDHGDPSSGSFDHGGDDGDVLVGAHGRRLSGGAHGDEAVNTGLDLGLDEALERFQHQTHRRIHFRSAGGEICL